jgi:hypothetical protein
MATWTATLPQHFQQGTYKETEKDLVIKFAPEAGPPMTRLRCESNEMLFSGEMLVSSAQKATLRTFWETNCAGTFDFPDPDTGVVIVVRFVDPPEYSDFVPGYWKVTLKMAKVP